MLEKFKTPALLEALNNRLQRVAALLHLETQHCYAPWIAKLILEREIDEFQRQVLTSAIHAYTQYYHSDPFLLLQYSEERAMHALEHIQRRHSVRKQRQTDIESSAAWAAALEPQRWQFDSEVAFVVAQKKHEQQKENGRSMNR
jgi:hypothetical protein